MEPRPASVHEEPSAIERVGKEREIGGTIFSPYRLVVLGTLANAMMQNAATLAADIRLGGWQRDWRVISAVNASAAVRDLEASIPDDEKTGLPQDDETTMWLAGELVRFDRGMMALYTAVMARNPSRLTDEQRDVYAGAMLIFEVIADRGNLYRTLTRITEGDAG